MNMKENDEERSVPFYNEKLHYKRRKCSIHKKIYKK